MHLVTKQDIPSFFMHGIAGEVMRRNESQLFLFLVIVFLFVTPNNKINHKNLCLSLYSSDPDPLIFLNPCLSFCSNITTPQNSTTPKSD